MGIANNKLWLNELAIPLTSTKNVRTVAEENHPPGVAKCSVELPARHRVISPMRVKDKSCLSQLRLQAEYLSETAVQGREDRCFGVKAGNLTANFVKIFKNHI